eukprot:gnl/MRDRNA2_/MRDRNA2_125285_c0_seq1.p1 gnl/MRDRNA2_/MRDRNA2_125285_c0~~gnl/MRDRNA2_/MRDRNA2_125285_c0_seq1.p1  ORF type:complete len:304 (-),score=47.91 gnl/MRDRNA2_/MRDRNA2_125285_c0_seq1:77-988(-)
MVALQSMNLSTYVVLHIVLLDTIQASRETCKANSHKFKGFGSVMLGTDAFEPGGKTPLAETVQVSETGSEATDEKPARMTNTIKASEIDSEPIEGKLAAITTTIKPLELSSDLPLEEKPAVMTKDIKAPEISGKFTQDTASRKNPVPQESSPSGNMMNKGSDHDQDSTFLNTGTLEEGIGSMLEDEVNEVEERPYQGPSADDMATYLAPECDKPKNFGCNIPHHESTWLTSADARCTCNNCVVLARLRKVSAHVLCDNSPMTEKQIYSKTNGAYKVASWTRCEYDTRQGTCLESYQEWQLKPD